VRDGQYVNAGDVLFQLDSRAAEAQLRQAQAQLARDRAQLAFAQQEVKRFSPLAEKSYLSREQFEQAQSTAAGSTAAVQADQAAVENAQALLSYYTITSPMDGRLGMVTLKTGNNVKANDVSFLTINQIKPIYVTFPVSERELPAIRRAMGDGSVAVSARAEGDSEPPSQGQLAFFENAVDPASGTITLRAIFVNHDERLWPGEFVKVSVTLAVEPNALVVPQAAVQIGQDSRYVFVVKPGNVAELRRVEVSRVVDGKAVIASGLEADESVVIDGQLRLSNGSRVEIRSAQGPTKPGNPS
jgi:multidrug efflux system membrane fusion protein